jgi:hypothetical protein
VLIDLDLRGAYPDTYANDIDPQLQFFPKEIHDKLVEVKHHRIEYKATGNPISDALKLFLNAISGLFKTLGTYNYLFA